MPKKLTIYDKGAPARPELDADGKPTGKTLPAVEAGPIERFAVTANEAVKNDPDRFSFRPHKSLTVSERDKAKVAGKPPGPKRTTSGPLKVEPTGREDTGARPPDESKEAAGKKAESDNAGDDTET